MGCEWDAYMGRLTLVGIRERGFMYCEWGMYVRRLTLVELRRVRPYVFVSDIGMGES